MHSLHFDPGVEADLAYRREVLVELGRGTRTRRNPWPARRRRRRAA